MAENRGKQFENVIRDSFNRVVNTSVIRLPDPVMGYLGYANVCDFIVYHYPNQYFIECKSVHGNTLNFSRITDNQWKGLSEVSKIIGVRAGVIIWFIDHDVTMYVPIQNLIEMKVRMGLKSVHVDVEHPFIFHLEGRKKRVFFDYNMVDFFERLK